MPGTSRGVFRGFVLIILSALADVQVLSEVEAVYETLPGWKQPLSGIRRFENLPPNAQAYVRRIEELVGFKSICIVTIMFERH